MASPLKTNTPLWHALPAEKVLHGLQSDPVRGLDQAEVEKRLAQFGPNRLPEGAKRGPWMRFVVQFDNVLVYILLAAGFVKAMLGLWLDAAIILAVVLVNAALGFIQEGKAEKALDSIRNMLSVDARTLRSGEARVVAAEDLVPGDVVLLESGDRIPADLRLIEAKNFRTEEAALTGESTPADKTTDAVAANSTVGDRHDMAFSGTFVLSGRALGVVVATGAQTELGRINQMLSAVDALETPLLRQIRDFGHTIAKVIGVVCALVFAYARWVRDAPFVDAFQAVVGIAVSVIPEGLPALITITLAIGVQRMAQRNAIIRRLPAVETLGSVSRICSDKTGTLTLMEMMVASVVASDAEYRVTGDGYSDEGQILRNDAPAAPGAVLRRMGTVSALCNDAQLRKEEGCWKVEGDPTEAALHPFAAKLGIDRDAENAGRRRIDAIPFESEHKFMATLHEEASGARMLLVKGAPEVLLAHCDRQETENGPASLERNYWSEMQDRLAARGERVLALAWLPDPQLTTTSLAPGDLPRTLILLGLVGLMDPPRKEAIDAVAECHAGGIRVTMITGDHKITAAAIGKMLGIGDGASAITGAEIEDMNEGALREAVRKVDVFARASPEHKLRLVKAIQANSQTVAMTGDGVNDAPALKRADVGVAMGIKGAEVTKEAAAMVLADDNFASITAAVREGRTVYNNIEKALLFMLPTNVAQALVILIAILVGFVMPVTAPQVLWVNMVTSVALGLVISFEPHEADVMRRPPRAVARPILDGFALWRVIFIGSMLFALTLIAFFWMRSTAASDELSRTVAVNALVIGQAFYLLNSRFKFDSCLSVQAHLGNTYLPLGVGAVVVLQLLFTYTPPLQNLFGTQAMPVEIWPWLMLGGFVFFLIVEAEKFAIRLLRRADGDAAIAGPEVAVRRPEAPAARTAAKSPGAYDAVWRSVMGLLALVVTADGALYWMSSRRAAEIYILQTVDHGPVARRIFLDGAIENALETAAVVEAPAAGRAETIGCEPNTKVRAGDVCATLTPLEQNKIQGLDQRLAAARARRDETAARLERAQRELENKQALVARGALPPAALRSIRADLQRARAAAQASEASLTRTRADLEQAQAQVPLKIVSPVSGTVVARNIAPGALVRPGTAPPLFVIAPADESVQVKLTLDPAEMNDAIKAQAPVAITVADAPHRRFAGQIASVARSERNGPYGIIVVSRAVDQSLAPGAKVKVELPAADRGSVLRAPQQAVDYSARRAANDRGAPAEGWTHLWAVRSGKAVPVQVRLGQGDGDHIEIVEGELSPGDQLIIDESRSRSAPAEDAGP